jgi:glycosyltransferase involved in cell wall biosynthesis
VKKDMRFSFILPIYNVDAYIEECLNSVISQTYTEFECLLIDDGSTDESATICKEYAEKDSRLSYFHKENGGLSDARNFGLKKAKGEYIVFVDSDDVVSPNLLTYVNECILNSSFDVVYFEHIKFFDSGKYFDKLFLVNDQVSPATLIDNKSLSQKPNFAWARVVQKKLYDGNLFPVGFIYEDILTSSIINFKAINIGYIKTPLYGYRKRANSITTSSAEKQFLLFNTLELLRSEALQYKLESVFYHTVFVNSIQSCLVSLARIEDADIRKEIRVLILREYKKITVSGVLKCYSIIKFKLLALCAKNNLTLYCLELMLRPLVKFSDRRNS